MLLWLDTPSHAQVFGLLFAPLHFLQVDPVAALGEPANNTASASATTDVPKDQHGATPAAVWVGVLVVMGAYRVHTSSMCADLI